MKPRCNFNRIKPKKSLIDISKEDWSESALAIKLPWNVNRFFKGSLE